MARKRTGDTTSREADFGSALARRWPGPDVNDDEPSNPTSHRWLNSALGRVAFGHATRSRFTRSRQTTLPSEALPALDLDDPEAREFGDYELLEEIGRGGMG